MPKPILNAFHRELFVARQAAQEAAGILNGLFGRLRHIQKKGAIDLVTDADLRAEQSILKHIRLSFPSDNILAEEAGKQKGSSTRTWIIDPLDGTTNFAHTFSFFAVSIALEIEGEIVLGLVNCPGNGEVFEAVKGMGASLNGQRIQVSDSQNLNDSLLGTGFPYDIRDNSEEILSIFNKILVKAQGVRRPGSAAIDLCYVAAGRFDGFWEQRLKPWDTAAGALIVTEAGGHVTDFEGTPYSPYSRSIIASNPHIYDELLKLLNE